jgi:O-methyltransferase
MFDLSLWQTQQMPLVQAIKSLTPPLLWNALYRAFVVRNVDGAARYRPQYSPWLEPEFKATYEAIRPHTLVSAERCWYVAAIARQALRVRGDVLEAGVFRGGTAILLKQEIERGGYTRMLYLHDSFEGMKRVDPAHDRHRVHDLSDTSLDRVQQVVGTGPSIVYRKGWIPETFLGLEQTVFCFSHVDVDLYQSVLDCCKFLYPRTAPGGFIVFDDYGFPNNAGARHAVDEYFVDKSEIPIVLQTGQAVMCKLPAPRA